MLLLPVGADQVVASGIRLAGKKSGQLQRAASRVKWLNQRLNNRDGAVIGARITPRFQVVRFVDVPVAKLCRLVIVQTEMDAKRDVGIFERIGKTQIGRRVISRIAAENRQQIHFPCPHVARQIAQRLGLVDGIGIDGVGVNDGLADVAERRIHRVRERMHNGRLMIAGNDDRRAPVTLQVFHYCGEKLLLLGLAPEMSRRRRPRASQPERERILQLPPRAAASDGRPSRRLTKEYFRPHRGD